MDTKQFDIVALDVSVSGLKSRASFSTARKETDRFRTVIDRSITSLNLARHTTQPIQLSILYEYIT